MKTLKQLIFVIKSRRLLTKIDFYPKVLSFSIVRFVFLSSVLLTASNITACDTISNTITEHLNQGTNIGYKKCIENNKDQGLRDDVVEKICVKKNEKRLYPKYEARGGYKQGLLFYEFEGRIHNQSNDSIITSVEIEVRHEDNRDAEGNIIPEILQIEDIWIEPGDKREFSSFVNFQPEPDRLRTENRALYSWSILLIRGISVKLR